MALYLLQARYTTEGVRGLLKEGGSKRRVVVQKMLEQAGGRLHAMYYSLGEDDVHLIAEVPDNTTAAALSMAVNASGAVQLKTTALLTAEEVDAAIKKTVSYRAPGG
ncbi:MAG TPA: GYD domain-containing protein [Thermoanaerobaculia bacterium]|nr:GYD domain-containing protein [Thermoanaerobaculia bacterium]